VQKTAWGLARVCKYFTQVGSGKNARGKQRDEGRLEDWMLLESVFFEFVIQSAATDAELPSRILLVAFS